MRAFSGPEKAQGMSANENQAHDSFIKKTPRQLVVVVVLSFFVLIIVVVLLWQLASSGRIYDRDSPAMSAEAIAKRIGPVADVGVEAGGAASPAAAAGPAAKAAALSVDGKKVYEATCIACHSTGVANAPKFGDKAAWAPHLHHGVAELYQSALKGKAAMPPKGGNLTLSDAEVRAAVDYMVSAVK
jgi:cytochrome c5